MYRGNPVKPETSPGLIRFSSCKNDCPDLCTNSGEWEYYDWRDEVWLKDSLITLTCLDGKGKYYMYLEYLRLYRSSHPE